MRTRFLIPSRQPMQMTHNTANGFSAYDDQQRQFAGSKYNHLPLPIHRSHEQQQQVAQSFQVDAWRSYRNDATNLQQNAGLSGYGNHGFTTINQQSPHWIKQPEYDHYPAAPPFQPIGSSSICTPATSRFTPYQPLRISNGGTGRNNFDTIRSNSSIANNRRACPYPLRSQNAPNPFATVRGMPASGIESQVMHSSSIPTNLGSHNQSQAFRHLTPRESIQSPTPPPAPSPSMDYLAQSSLQPEKLTNSQKLLIVVDLNGTLLKRNVSRGTTFVLRPGVATFMDYLFQNHAVMIYTSSRPENAQGMVSKLLSPKQRKQLVAIWARDKLDLNHTQYFSKVQVYKKLEKIWADEGIQQQAGKDRRWDQTNTILLDDSHLKALAQPYNLLEVEEFINDRPFRHLPQGKIQSKEQLDALNAWNLAQQQILKDLHAKLEDLKWTKDVSRLIRKWQFDSPEPEQAQLLTPKSHELQVSDDDESDGGVDTRQLDISELAESVEDQNMSVDSADIDGFSDSASDGSVSSIDEAVWKDILGGVEQRKGLR